MFLNVLTVFDAALVTGLVYLNGTDGKRYLHLNNAAAAAGYQDVYISVDNGSVSYTAP